MKRYARKTAICSAFGLLVALWPRVGEAAPPDEQTKAEDPNAPTVQRPSTSGAPPAPADAPTDRPGPRDPAPDAPAPAEPAPAEPATPEPATAGLLDPSADVAPAPRPAPAGDPVGAGISREEKATRYYDDLYRPDDNPARLNIGARALFMAAGAKDSQVSGRMAGLTLDAGHTWNWIGYAITGTLYGGQTILGKTQEYEYNMMVGGGPTLSLGRLALVRHGFLDARIGYDFFYAPTKVSFIGASDGITSAPDNVTPHGPRLRLDIGLLLHRSLYAKRRHGVGASFGYQMLVGSLTGEMARSNVLMVGLTYFMG
jgi:hypothetical protein